MVTDLPPGALPVPVVPGLTGLSLLARGGYATIYRATQQFVGREVAVKVENRTLTTERDRRRFLREARAAARMSSHPHVVDLFDAGITADGHPYLIMELCDGSYADRMRTSRLGAAEARDLGVKIADALADAHHLGVLHRDVKPANILRTRFGEPALADFGLAVIAESRDPTVTLEVLTPAYAAPEMFRNSPPSPAVDVYALCATLYAVMNGRPPRWKDDTNPGLLTILELFDEPIPDLPGVPPAFIEVLRRGMANDPADRPSAAQLRDLLAALSLDAPPAPAPSPPSATSAGNAGPASRPHQPPPATRPVPAHVAPPPAHVAPPPPPAPARRGGSRSPWLLGAVGVFALLVAITAGWLLATDLDLVPPLDPAPTAQAQGSASAVGSATPSAAGAATAPAPRGPLPGCLNPLPGDGRCPAELECFGPITEGDAGPRAERVPCDGRHSWEVFAVGELPGGIDPAAIEEHPVVQEVCGERSFRLVTLGMAATGWQFRVLPPDAEALASGDRTYRCLAGRGPDSLIGPTLTG